MYKLSLCTLICFLFTGLMPLAMTGCGNASERLDRRDERDPLIIRGDARKRAGDIDGAIDLYQQALDRKPQLALAHLKLAVEYDEHKRDYLRAIYHYSRYLEMRPRAQKNELVEELIRLARVSYVASLPNPPPGALEKISLLEQENSRLREQVTSLTQRLTKTTDELNDANQRAAAAASTATQQTSRPVTTPTTTTTSRPTGSAATPSTPVRGQTPSQPETYRVQAGDTLTRIASRMYDDPNQWNRIYEANRDILPRPESLREGQTLVIPR